MEILMRISAYGDVNLVPIAPPNICFLTLSWNSKKLLFKTNWANLIRSFEETFDEGFSSIYYLSASKTFLCDIFG